MTKHGIVIGLGVLACVLSGSRATATQSSSAPLRAVASLAVEGMQSQGQQDSVATRNGDSVRRVWKGYESGFPYALRAVAKDSATFHALWTQAVSRNPRPPALPQIDFGREMVIVAAMGEQGGTGRDIGVDSVRRVGRTLTVFVHVSSGGLYCGEMEGTIYPADIIAIPRHQETVLFHDSQTQRSCKSSTWGKPK